MNFDGSRQNCLAESSRAFVVGQGFEVEFDSFPNIGQGLFDSLALGLTSLQFRTPSVASVLALFDHHTDLACHSSFSLSSDGTARAPSHAR